MANPKRNICIVEEVPEFFGSRVFCVFPLVQKRIRPKVIKKYFVCYCTVFMCDFPSHRTERFKTQKNTTELQMTIF